MRESEIKGIFHSHAIVSQKILIENDRNSVASHGWLLGSECHDWLLIASTHFIQPEGNTGLET